MQNTWGKCVLLVALLFIPYFTGVLHPEFASENYFSNSYFEPAFSALLTPGMILSMIFVLPIVRLFGWAESQELTVVFFAAGIIASMFWGTILAWGHTFLFAKEEKVVVKLVPKKKSVRRKKAKTKSKAKKTE